MEKTRLRQEKNEKDTLGSVYLRNRMKFRVDSHAHDLYGEGIDNASNDRANVYFSTEYEGEN